MFLGSALDESVANLIIAQLLHLEGEDAERPVNLYINSPGGDMTALFAVYDAMQFMGPRRAHRVRRPGVLGGRGAAGRRRAAATGRRCPTPASSSTSPTAAPRASRPTWRSQVREMVTMRERMVDILTERTDQTRERIEADIDRDYILRGEEAVAYGLVDEVIVHRRPRPVPGFVRTDEPAAAAV